MGTILTLTTPEGTILGQPLPIDLITYSVIEHDVGSLHCRFGIDWLPYLDYEYRIEAWRTLPMLDPILIRTYLIENITVITDEAKRSEVSLDAYDFNYLLKTRDNEATADSAEATKTDFADDAMKDYVREQLGAVADDPLDSRYFRVDADASAGPSVSVNNAWGNLLSTLRELSDAAAAANDGAGPRVYFMVDEDSTPSTYVFRTATSQLGTDRSAGTTNARYVGLDYGNVRSITMIRDASEEVNHVLSGGSGEKDQRLIGEAEGTGATRNIWSRKKLFYNDNTYKTQAGVTAQAQRRLKEKLPKERLIAELMEAPGFRYGLDWGFGDRLTIAHEGADYTGIVKAVTFWTYENGAERAQAVLEIDL